MSKKRAAHTTKGRQGRKTTPAKKAVPAKATDPAPVKAKAKAKAPKAPPEVKTKTVEPAKKAPKVRAKFTLDQAIEWFKKDPHAEEFFCTDAPGFALAHGNYYLQFKKGHFVTADPAEVEILMRSRQFNLFIYAVNPTLRNLRK